MATDPRFTQATSWGREAPRQTFGQVAQRANPQKTDAFQNMNTTGLPVAPKPRFTDMNREARPRLQPGGGGQVGGTAQLGAPAIQPIKPLPPVSETVGVGAPPVRQPVLEQNVVDPVRGTGRYTAGGYEPIAEDERWGGAGYSGPDPRDVGVAAAPAPQPFTQLPPELQGLVPGAGATAQGGKSGGQPPAPQPAPQPTPAPPPAPGGAPPGVQPPGTIGSTGGSQPIVFEDTGEYNPNIGETGGFGGTPFDPNSSIPGVQTVKPNLSNPHPKVQKRLNEYIAAGGDPNNFVVIDNSIWQSVLAQYPQSQRNAMKKQMKNKFYADQIASLGTGTPGVQG